MRSSFDQRAMNRILRQLPSAFLMALLFVANSKNIGRRWILIAPTTSFPIQWVTTTTKSTIHGRGIIKCPSGARIEPSVDIFRTTQITTNEGFSRRFALAAISAGSESNNDTDSIADTQGRRMRSRRTSVEEDDSQSSTGWENFDPMKSVVPRRYGIAGWVDDNEGWDDTQTTVKSRLPNDGPKNKPLRSESSYKRSRRDDGRSSNNSNRSSPQRRDTNGRRLDDRRDNSRGRSYNTEEKEADDRRINMRALELAGFDHLYGLASVLNALQAGVRDFSRPEDRIPLESLVGEELQHELAQRARKPEAQFSPWLFVQHDAIQQQERGSVVRSSEKTSQAVKVLELAAERGIPVATVDKGILNTLSSNRPHQGYVLRCGKLFLEDSSVTTLPVRADEENYRPFWLVLDEVVDPQNLGALLRSAYFLGGSAVDRRLGILVCAKNSAPPSPTVSAASAGALELFMTATSGSRHGGDTTLTPTTTYSGSIFSTSNLPRTLATAEASGFRVVGASSSIPNDLDGVPLYNLQDLPLLQLEASSGQPPSRPTVLVLGSEGRGLRSLVAKSCTEFVRIPSGNDSNTGVDSLNVSVTGGILLWHFLQPQRLIT